MRDGDGEIVHQLRTVLNGDGAQRIRRAIELLDRIANTQVARRRPALANDDEGVLICTAERAEGAELPF